MRLALASSRTALWLMPRIFALSVVVIIGFSTLIAITHLRSATKAAQAPSHAGPAERSEWR
jgi:hypothetical protein